MTAGSAGRREVPLRAIDILRTLIAHRVEFIVIGGFALAAHGYVRGTKDLDVVPEPGRENLELLLAALRELEAEPLALGDFKPEELVELSLENLMLGGNWLLRTRYGRLDVMQFAPGMRSYRDLRERAVVHVPEGVPGEPLFVGLDDLVALKRSAGRRQDLLDIAELERARGG